MILIECIYNNACQANSSCLAVLQIVIAAFLSILYLQSGLDKVFNYQSELEWLTKHFSKSLLKNSVNLLLPTLTLLELFTGVVNVVAIVFVFVGCASCWFYCGCLVSCIALLCLFFGQRMAKDYAGAASLVPYFILSVIGLIVVYL